MASLPPPASATALRGSAALRRPQLTPEELQQLRWLLGNVLTLLAASTIFYMDVDAWTLMALTSIAAVAVLARPTLPAAVPRFVHTLAFPAILAFCAGDLWLRAEVLPAMVRLDMLLLLYRTISYRQRRDDLQVIVLGLFLIIIAGVLTVSLTFAAQILLYTGCALAFLLVITLSDPALARSSAAAVAGSRGVPPAWALHADWPRLFRRLRVVTNWRVIGFGVALFTGVVVVSAVLFLAIPRFQLETGMLLDRFISKKARSGFSDRIRFGDVSEIVQDTSIALSVDISDQSQIPATPYWRMLVLDHYQDGTFRLSGQLRRERFERERPASFMIGRALSKPGPAVLWTFYLEPGVSRFLPLLGHFERIRFREMQTFIAAPTLALVELRAEPVTMTAYLAEDFDLSATIADPDFARRWRSREAMQPTALQLQTELRLNETDLAAVQRIAAEVLGETPLPPIEAAQRINTWLRRNHEYTLSPRIPGGEGDPLVRWLVSREAGHCELFAGSFVLLARAAGHPARVVTGFRGGTWNAYSQNFTIRNSDAHAWAEIFDPTAANQHGGWVRSDPLGAPAGSQAAEARGAAAITARLDRSWTARLDSLRVFWYRRIVSFDERSQAETLRLMKQATQNMGKRLREALQNSLGWVRAWATAPWDARRWLKLGAVLGAAGLLVWGWVACGQEWWRMLRRARVRRSDDPVRREASHWLRQVAEADELAVASEVGGERATPVAPLLRDVVPELQRLRFGRRETWPSPKVVFQRARHAVRAARRQRNVTRSSA